MSYPSPRYLGDSGEVSGLYRWDMGPGPSGPDPHFHKTISESFFMLSGEVRLYDGERWIGATAGDFLYVPEGGIHAVPQRLEVVLPRGAGCEEDQHRRRLSRLVPTRQGRRR